MLNRAKLEYFKSFLANILANPASSEDAYTYALRYLEDIIVEYHTHQGAIDKENLAKFQEDKTPHWNKYQRIQEKLAAIAELEKNNPKKLQEAFDTIHDKYFVPSRCEPLYDKKLLGEEPAGLAEIAFGFSKVFTFGIAGDIEQKYDEYLKIISDKEKTGAVRRSTANNVNLETTVLLIGDAVHTSVTHLNRARLSEFVKEAFTLRKELLAKIATKKQTLRQLQAQDASSFDSGSLVGARQPTREEKQITAEIMALELILNSFKVSCNDAIRLLHLESKYKDKKEELESLRPLVETAFKEYLCAGVTRMGAGELEVDDENFYTRILFACDEIISKKRANKDKDKRALALELKRNILMFHQPDVIPTEFGIMNPVLTFGQSGTEQYRALIFQLSKKIKNNKIIKNIIENVENIPKERGLFSKLKEWFFNITPSDAEGAEATDEIFDELKRYVRTFKVASVSDYIKLGYALNQTAFNDCKDGPLKAVSSKRSVDLVQADDANIDGIYGSAGLPLRKGVERNILALRVYVNSHAEEFKTLIASGQNGSLHDLYFEINLARNISIKESIENKYNSAVSSFPRTLLNIFGKPPLEERRVTPLSNLMDQLITCKTEADYLEFFVQANNLLINCSGNLRWDSLFKEAVQESMCAVVQHHLLNNKLQLNFTIEQLEIVNKLLKANRLGKEEVCIKLEKTIIERKSRRSDLPDQRKLSAANKLVENAEKRGADLNEENKRRANESKIDAFKTSLLQKLESNILADIVISTGKFKINNRDIGIIAGKLTSVMSMVDLPFIKNIAAIMQEKADGIDVARQVQEGVITSTMAAKFGGYQMMFNEIITSVVKEICMMFEMQIKQMHSSEEAERFAEFCYKRIYAGLKMSEEERKKLKCDTNIRDFLLASVFLRRKDVTSNPFIKDHYRREGDESPWPKTTFQGLVDNVSFFTEEATPNTNGAILVPVPGGADPLAPIPVPEAMASTDKDKQPVMIERIDRSDVPIVAANPAMQNSTKLINTAIKVYSTPSKLSKLPKYGFSKAPASLPFKQLGRAMLKGEKLRKRELTPEELKTIDAGLLAHGKKR